MFTSLPEKFSFTRAEKETLELWRSEGAFARTLTAREGAPNFTFFEGPPTVNGSPGIHHVFSRTLKDAICRYKTMQGFRVERKAGWDTHGLPVEIALEKLHGFKRKDEIAAYGVRKFNEECRKFVFDNIEKNAGWREVTERMGYWLDFDNAYITCTNEYIESIWWALKKFFDAGKIYRGYKIQPYCPRCETPLSSHEVAQGYDIVKDPSTFVKFKREGADEYFLVWTTTPWTLLSNVAIAAGPDIDYIRARGRQRIGKELSEKTETLILAKSRMAVLEGEYEVVDEFKGKTLERLRYEQLFPDMKLEGDGLYVVLADYVSTEDGTGLVHTAPAFGEDDFAISKVYNLPFVNPVNKSGEFTSEVKDFAGKFVKDADGDIMQNLKSRGLLYKKSVIEHSYPHCWRCDSPLLYYARTSWYIRTTDYARRMVELNKTINWNPPEIGEGRFGNWLEENKDWALSRDRFWGTPLPIWICEDTGEMRAIGSMEELKKGEVETAPGQFVPVTDRNVTIDLHKPFVDHVVFREGEKIFRRTPELIDVWFDSGSMPFAQHHYPFENKELFEKSFPAEYIAEGVDQTRGWFYTLHAISTFLFDKPAFRNIIVNDMILDNKGQKMSKSKGNIVNPFDVMERFGADAVRWYLVETSPPWRPKMFSEDEIGEVARKFFSTLANTYSFFSLYANIDKYSRDEKKSIPIGERALIDQWLVSSLHSLVKEVTACYDTYDLTRAARAIQDFTLDGLSNWYVRRNRRRFWKGEASRDKQAAYDTLYEALETIVKLAAPIAPFFSDYLYRRLVSDGEIHIAGFPKTNERVIDKPLEERMRRAQTVVGLVRNLRERAKLKVRQPVQKILLPVTAEGQITEWKKIEDIILEEINAKHIEYVTGDAGGILAKTAKANFKTLGARLGKKMKAVAAKIVEMNPQEITAFEEAGTFTVHVDGEDIVARREDIDITTHDIEGWIVASTGGITVALDTHINQELRSEGYAREFVSRVQNLRKEKGFEVTDRITISFSSSDRLRTALEAMKEYIMAETLATSLKYSPTVKAEPFEVNDELCSVELEKN